MAPAVVGHSTTVYVPDLTALNTMGAAALDGPSGLAARNGDGGVAEMLTANSSKYATPLNDNSRVPSPDVEPTEPSDSDSESENDIGRGLSEISNQRRCQNLKFANWLSERTAKVTEEEVEAVAKNANDEELSIRTLMSKQESQVIIDDPRDYQLELFEKAKQQNIIAVLDTGTTAAEIACVRAKRAQAPVNCVTLVFQQYAVLDCNLDQTIDRFCGEMGCDLWDRETWQKAFSENKVIVCTAEILCQCLMHCFICMEEINLLIFDEAHHTKKNHAYARIIKDYYILKDTAKRPKIFGMTASPVDAHQDPVKAAKHLEAMLHSQIATASDLSLLQSFISRPREQLLRYDRLEYPYDTPLSKHMIANFGDITGFSKIFQNAREATGNLGDWCADQLWTFALAEGEALKIEQKTERRFLSEKENTPVRMLDAKVNRIREAKDVVAKWPSQPLSLERNCISPKVLLLHQYLAMTFERPTEAKCIVFVTRRYTAQALGELFTRVGSAHLRLGLLMGTRSGDPGDIKFSVKQQVLTLAKFRKGDLNCLISTSIAEEGLDIPDCNVVIRFDLYTTLIQYIQSRGRARHTNSKYLHMVEADNAAHLQAVDLVRKGEAKMRRFCEALPEDRLLKGNEYELETALAKERSHRRYVDPETGATLTYNSSLVVLAHFVGRLPQNVDAVQHAQYNISTENKKFVCEVILPENSPLHAATGRPCSRKSIAKRSAAFEACCILRQMGHLDSNLIPKYHKLLPQMRNARLALGSARSTTYTMKIKPSLWEESRGTRPTALYMTIIELKHPENLGRPCQPLALLTRTPLPEFPPFLLYLQVGKTSDVICSSLSTSFDIGGPTLADVNEFTLRIYKDIFNKTFEVNEAEMSYWLAPVYTDWKTRHATTPSPQKLVDWSVVKQVSNTLEIPWTVDTPHNRLIHKYLIDRWDGGRRFFSIAVEPDIKPLDPVPEDAASHKYMANILDYSVSLYAKSRARVSWRHDQPVMRAEKIQHRLNWLDDLTEKEKNVNSTCYLCPEPLKFSALPIGVVAMAYMCPAVITRLENYLITLEACHLLGLEVEPGLALEALTKDSNNTEEHKADQIHVQRGMGKNYERLEFLGDCFLKMATSISLFSRSPDNNEFEYHVKRMLMVCNKNLLKTALEKKFYEHIRSMAFSRRHWYPQGIKLLEGKGHKKTSFEVVKHCLGEKTIADVCEAMIGAALLSSRDKGEMDMAVKAVTIFVASSDHCVTKWADYYPLYEKPKYQVAEATASQIDLAVQIEKDIGYHFRYPRLLRSAFIHPSYPFTVEKIPCYQRLEFLGDSLLDMASINFLYHRHPDRDPQWLTEHKMAMVSNKFLAAVSVRLGFHKHLRAIGTNVEVHNREYVMEIREAEAEAEGARDYWTNTKQPPKALSDIVESYIGAVFVDSEYNFAEVESFFNNHIRWFFEDMSIYDTFASNHPTTYLHNLLSVSFGCTSYRLMASEIPSVIPGSTTTSAIAAVMIHDEIVTEGQASSSKNAKIKASQNALGLLKGLAPLEFRRQYQCDCETAAQGKEEKRRWLGREEEGVGMMGSAI
ncbi:MAG: hypothetical protein Q9217_004514 [Psora testacea]